MRHGQVGWRFLAIALSLMIHGLLFVNLNKRELMASSSENSLAEPTRVRLAFRQPEPLPPEPEPEPRPEPEPEPKPEPEPEPELKPEPEPEPMLEPEPKPVPKPAIKPKPKPKAKSKPKPKPKAKLKPVKPRVSTPPRSQRQKPAATAVNAAKLRKQYLASLLARIEKRKSYPQAARRRAIEGKVRVSFTVGCNGSASKIDVQRGHKLLKRSAAKAVEAAKPFPRPPAGVNCPLPVNYEMAFKLQ